MELENTYCFISQNGIISENLAVRYGRIKKRHGQKKSGENGILKFE